jgi:hypothetical protein
VSRASNSSTAGDKREEAKKTYQVEFPVFSFTFYGHSSFRFPARRNISSTEYRGVLDASDSCT